MAADVASLAVALHLNSASFKSQFADAMRTADSSAQQFNRKVQTDNQKTRQSFEGLGKGITGLDADFNKLGKTVDKRLTGLDEMRGLLANISAGSTVAGSSITTALVSALSEGMSTALDNSITGLKSQRQAQIEFTQAQISAAQGSIENARQRVLKLSRSRISRLRPLKPPVPTASAPLRSMSILPNRPR